MKVEIIVDGKNLKLNKFVQKITFGVSSGLVDSLRDIPDWSAIEIRLEK
jgi:hypothetical protein